MISENDVKSDLEKCSSVWSIERQVRIAAGLFVLIGIALAYSVYPPFIWLSILIALGMVLSGLTNSCALGSLLQQFPWNK